MCRRVPSASRGVSSATSPDGRSVAGRTRPPRRPPGRLCSGRPRPTRVILRLNRLPTPNQHRPTGSGERMGTIVAENRKALMLFSGRAYPELAEEIGDVLGVPPTPTDAYEFANGEIFVRYRESVRGCDAFVVQSMAAPINQSLVESLIMVDALKRGSAKRITVVLPFYPYARQDKKHRGREPISARLIFDLYKTAGANRILTVDLHTAQIQGFFDGPVDHLFAMDTLAGYMEKRFAGRPMTVVAPDSGRVRVAERWTDRLGGCPLA